MEGNWPIQLVANNFSSLKELSLGFRALVARTYERDGTWSEDMYTPYTISLGNLMRKELREIDGPSKYPLRLRRLKLCGLDLRVIIHGRIGIHFYFRGLRTLVLHSCSGLSQGPTLLRNKDKGSSNPPGPINVFVNLRILQIRHEMTTPLFQIQLETFLTSLHPLVSLQILLEGTFPPQNVEPILKVHGRRLKYLVWDERSCRRTSARDDTTIMPVGFLRLGTISDMCPRLISLGLSLDWRTPTEEWQEYVRVLCS